MKRIIRMALAILLGLVVLIGVGVGYLTVRHQQTVNQIEREWQAAQAPQIVDLGATQSLTILPLVDEAASGAGFQAEHGVSYWIKTDTGTIARRPHDRRFVPPLLPVIRTLSSVNRST